MHVSVVLTTASPNGTLTYFPISEPVEQTLRKHTVLQLNTNLTSDALDHSWEIVVFNLTMFRPWRKVAHLAVIPVIR